MGARAFRLSDAAILKGLEMNLPMMGQETPMLAKAARRLLQMGEAPENLVVSEPIQLQKLSIKLLPPGLTAPSLRMTCDTLEALPARLNIRRIRVHCRKLKSVGPGLQCDVLDLADSSIEELPQDMQARQRINLSGCAQLKTLPGNLVTGSLQLNQCVSLKELPRGLSVSFLELAGCTSLRRLPDDLRMNGGHLILRDCPWITNLPDELGEISGLDISGCLNLTKLPENLKVTSWIDIAGSAVTELPEGLKNVGLRWRGIPVSHRIVFQPETLRAEEILTERNAELRRVMIERLGYEKLLEIARAVELDRDQDAGGERRLLRIPLEGDEDVVCVSVQCPSTGHRFILRVPPYMTSCRQAVAWTAGYDNPDDYAPSVES